MEFAGQQLRGLARYAYWILIAVILPATSEVVVQGYITQFHMPLGVVSGVVAIIGALHIYTQRKDNVLRRLKYQWRVGKWAGISQVYPVASYPDLGQTAVQVPVRDLADTVLVEMVKTSNHIQMLLASGWKILGCDKHKGLLFPILEGRDGVLHLEVLLLDPDSPAAKERAEAEAIEHDDYRNGVRAVLWTLAHWKNSRHFKVEAYLYPKDPIWQMVITPFDIWLLCASRNVATGTSPRYCLRRLAEFGLAFGFMAVWARRRASAKPVDLDAVLQTPPDWKGLRNR